MLFAELVAFAYTCNLLIGKGWGSDDDPFRLHSFELLEINMVNLFVPQLNVSVSSMAVGKHCRFHLMRVEDEHPTLSATASDKSTFFFDEASFVVEMNLHALFHYLTN